MTWPISDARMRGAAQRAADAATAERYGPQAAAPVRNWRTVEGTLMDWFEDQGWRLEMLDGHRHAFKTCLLGGFGDAREFCDADNEGIDLTALAQRLCEG